jgi:hypothetical protein
MTDWATPKIAINNKTENFLVGTDKSPMNDLLQKWPVIPVHVFTAEKTRTDQ